MTAGRPRIGRRHRVALAAAVVLGACGGVEPDPRPREPLRPIDAVRRDATAPAPPADCGLGVAEFAAAVVAAWRRDPAPVAVLPAFSDDPLHPRGTQVFATGAGDWLAAQTVAALRAAEPALEVWAPDAVVRELLRRNRSLRDVAVTQDALALVAQTDAGYLVYGNLEKAIPGGRLSGQAEVRVRWLGVALARGEVVASCERTLTAPEVVRELGARAERASVVLVGQRAPPFTPSLDAEVARTTEQVLARLVGAHRATIAGKRCAVRVDAPPTDAGRALAVTVRDTLLARLPHALPGRDAIVVGDPAAAHDVLLVAVFERGADRYALALSALPAGGGPAVRASVPFAPRFAAALRQVLP